MAIYVNGKKVAGRGISGKSPYQIAVSEGYTGTEAEFNAQLAAIGEAVAGFEELSDQVDSAKAEVEAAVTQARTDIDKIVDDAQAAVEEAQKAVDDALADIEEAKTDVQTTVDTAKEEIEQAKQDAINAIPNAENLVVKDDLTDYATQTWVTTQITNATAAIVTDIWYYGSTAPDNTKLLWIDSNATTGGLKFYKSASDGWVHVPVAWQ